MTDKNYTDPTAPAELMGQLQTYLEKLIDPLSKDNAEEVQLEDMRKAVHQMGVVLGIALYFVGQQPLRTGLDLEDIKTRLVDLEKEAVELAPAIGFLVD